MPYSAADRHFILFMPDMYRFESSYERWWSTSATVRDGEPAEPEEDDLPDILSQIRAKCPTLY